MVRLSKAKRSLRKLRARRVSKKNVKSKSRTNKKRLSKRTLLKHVRQRRSRSISNRRKQSKSRKTVQKHRKNKNKGWTEDTRKLKFDLIKLKATQIKRTKKYVDNLELLKKSGALTSDGLQTLTQLQKNIVEYEDELRKMKTEYDANTAGAGAGSATVPSPLPSAAPRAPTTTMTPVPSLYSSLYSTPHILSTGKLPPAEATLGYWNPIPPMDISGVPQPLNPYMPLWPYFQSVPDATKFAPTTTNHGLLLSKEEFAQRKTYRSLLVVKADNAMWAALNAKRETINGFKSFFEAVCDELDAWRTGGKERWVKAWILFTKGIARFMNVFVCQTSKFETDLWSHKCHRDHVLKVVSSDKPGVNRYALAQMAEAIAFAYCWQFYGPRNEKYIEFLSFDLEKTLNQYFAKYPKGPNGGSGYVGMPIPSPALLPRFRHVGISRRISSSDGFYADCNNLHRLTALVYASDGGGGGGGGMRDADLQAFSDRLPLVPTTTPSVTSSRVGVAPLPAS